EQNSGEELADLNLYSYLFPTQPDEKTTAVLIDSLNALSSVEIAYPEAITRPAAVDLPPTTSDYTAGQGYLNRAAAGSDARYAWNLPGGRGNDTRIIDIEFGWTLEHEDLPTAFFDGRVSGQQSIVQPAYIEHGTAVIGQLVADKNSYGVTG